MGDQPMEFISADADTTRRPNAGDEKDKERKSIRGAMDRLLSGTAIRIPPDSKLTVRNLAAEAQVTMPALNRRHTDLKDEFMARRDAMDDAGKSGRERKLEDANDELSARVTRQAEELRQWKDATHDLARINALLKTQIAQKDKAIEALKKRLNEQGVASVSVLPAPRQ
jgi:hypothetical protein